MSIEVSVIVPTHNCARFLPESLDSILSQGVDDMELILVDDGSVDETPRLAEDYVRKYGPDKIIYVRQAKRGPAAARNAGVRRARGKLIAFNDADDIWVPGSLKKRLEYLAVHPGTAMVCADGTNMDVEMKNVIDKSYFRSRRPYDAFSAGGYVFDDLFNYILDIALVLTPTVVLRRECLDEVGIFDESLPVGEDKELWFRIGRKYHIAAIPEVMLHRRIHAGNISHGEMVRRVSYTLIADKIYRHDPAYYQAHRAQFDRWLATMHHELGYFLFQKGEYFHAAAEQMASLRKQFRLKSLFDLGASLFAGFVGKRLFDFFRSIKHHCF